MCLASCVQGAFLPILLFPLTSHSQKDTVKLGVVFSRKDWNSTAVKAFDESVQMINEREDILPNRRLIYSPIFSDDNTFQLTKAVCAGIGAGFRAVIGPSSQLSSMHVQSICHGLDIPHIDTQPGTTKKGGFSLKLHPSYKHINMALRDFVVDANWSSVSIVHHQATPSILNLQEILLASGVEVLSRRLPRGAEVAGTHLHDVLHDIKRHNSFNMLLDIEPKLLPAFFSECRERGLLAEGAQFMMMSIDYNIQEVLKYQLSGEMRSFSFFRLIDPENQAMQELANRLGLCRGRACRLDLQSALMYDSLMVFSYGVMEMNFREALDGAHTVSCSEEQAWDYGASLYNYLNSVQTTGITGDIRIGHGERMKLHLDLVKFQSETRSTSMLGEWNLDSGLKIFDKTLIGSNETGIPNLMVVTREEPPYVMISCDNCTGNSRFSGFAIDLLTAISKVADFTFTLYRVPDNIYGVFDHQTKEWNGIVRELLDRKADIAVAPMTINFARENVIDFTKPFMNLGISILFKKPEVAPAQLFSFMNPLALEIWIYILLAYILVSLTIWIVARFSPHEWANPHPCVDTGFVVQNDFTLANSFWFAVGTLMQQGSDLNPKAASTRIVGGIWWFFTLIIISSYTANLAAFLTVERMATPIENADDLADQSLIQYGTLRSGSTMTFFRDSKIETYQKMWRYMESKDPTVFTKTYEEGVERVLKGNFAFLCESAMLDYFVQQDCNLTQIGGLLDSKGYGIATPKGSRWRDRISQAILYLQEKSAIQMLYNQWWDKNGKDKTKVCPKTDIDPTKASALNVVNIGGVFVVLLCGLSFAVLVAVAEFCWKAQGEKAVGKKSSDEQGLLSPWLHLCSLITRFDHKRKDPGACNRCQLIRENQNQSIRYM